MNKTLIVSGFPGVGKSFYVSNSPACLDSDSSAFDKSLFPQNYIEHIKSQLGVVPIIFVSSHKEVRNALVAEGLHYILVYPDYSLKEEYLARYKKRGSEDSFINLMREYWTDFILDMKGQSGCTHLVLQRREFVSKCFLKEKSDEAILGVVWGPDGSVDMVLTDPPYGTTACKWESIKKDGSVTTITQNHSGTGDNIGRLNIKIPKYLRE